MGFLKRISILIFFVVVPALWVKVESATATASPTAPPGAAKKIKITPLPANFSFDDTVRALPNGEIRDSVFNPSKKDWDKEKATEFLNPSKKRIIGGRHITVRETPYQVMLGHRGSGHTCGATIYNKLWIITAAHCLYGGNYLRDKSEFNIVVGDSDLSLKEKECEQTRSVVKVIGHEGFAKTQDMNDIGLLQLNESLTYNQFVQPLPIGDPNEAYPPSGEALISGWGYTLVRRNKEGYRSSAYPNVLKWTSIQVFSRDECKQIYKNVAWMKKYVEAPGYMCAGEIEGGKDACQGDSGGPLACFHPTTKRKYLCGVISTGIGCGMPATPGLFSITAHFASWIKKHAGEPDQPTIPY